MASTFECSRNDVISNVGVLIAAGAVAVLASPWPDIVIGGIMAAIILRSAFRVLREAIPKASRPGEERSLKAQSEDLNALARVSRSKCK